ncbi:restriction endonuclease [Bordetella sp. BOR01]|uniref:restriction endonuclease n=1 Tax=Bordetella sp. BOR01 TaxID=2854779 RepID=UPI001C48C1D0|nr:restriction endonuclease [Bordetella sp. BOR01]MBV7485890.1 restriction endonuclease [Bordetella sp. BOR01]
MKFMAKNSLFAILLRSPWWISMLVAAALIVIGLAALPPAYAPFPIFAAIPFLAIAGIAAWKQRGKPSSARVEQTATDLAALPWAAFADVLEAALRRDGCEVKRLNGAAADFEVTRTGGGRALLTARRWKAAHTGVEPLQRLEAARASAGASEGIYVALGAPSAPALDYATRHNIRFMDAEALARLLPRGVPQAPPQR